MLLSFVEVFFEKITAYRLVVLAAMFCFSGLFKPRKNCVAKALILSALYAVIPWVISYCTGNQFVITEIFRVNAWYSASYLVYWVLAMGIFAACFQCSFKAAVFCGLASYSVQCIAFYTSSIFRYVFLESQIGLAHWFAYFWIILIVLAVFYFVFVRKLRDNLANLESGRLLLFLALALFTINIFSQRWQYSYIIERNFNVVEIFGTVFLLIIGVLLLIVQFGFFEETSLREDKLILDNALWSAKKQYALSRENIEIINRKCHDMRHQINALRTISDEKQRQALFQETEKAVEIYSEIAKTGNSALDVVLTEKSFLCQQHEIDFTYMLSGEDFAFMDTADVYSLFGNALDNAIEAVSGCPEREKRFISIREIRREGFLNLTFENYCDRTLKFENGLPVTTKGDTAYHGFGTKSIRYIAEKYGGSAHMCQEENRFVLRLYFVKPL